MITKASVRVRSSTGGNAKPDPTHVADAAHLLQEGGFDILKIGRFGVSVQADDSVFTRELGVEVPTQQGIGLAVEPAPQSSKLDKLIDLVEVTPEATSF